MRFPEFSGEWVETELQDIVPNICSGKDRISNSGEVALYGSTGVIGRTNSASYKENIVLVARVGANAGQMQIGNAPCGVTDNTLVIDAKEWNYYIYYFLQHYNLNRLVFGSGQPLITGGMLKRIKVRYGCKAERNNITRLLCLIDERIATQNKIIEKLESLIRGLCLKLVSQGIPNTALNTCLECHSSILQEKSVTTDGKYPVYGAAGICGYSNTPEASGDSILIIKDGASVGATFYVSGEYSAIGTLNRLTARSGCSLRYLYYCLKIFDFSQYKTGQTIPHIYFRDYGIAKIWRPSLAQQEHIAGILTSIDTKIQMERSLLERLTIQKRFLLQKMFI